MSSADHGTPGVRSEVTAALADASGVRRSWLTAASSAVRIRSAAAIGLAASASAVSRCCSSATPACAANALSTRRSPAGSGRPRRASDSESEIGTSTSASSGRTAGDSPADATQFHFATGPRSASPPPAAEPHSSSDTDRIPNASRVRSRTASTEPCPRTAAGAPVPLAEHRVRLADADRGPEVNSQLPAPGTRPPMMSPTLGEDLPA